MALSAEQLDVDGALELCNILGLKPEDMGLRKEPNGTYSVTHKAVMIVEEVIRSLKQSA